MASLPLPIDLDRSGNSYQGLRVYLGPSLGWVQTRVKPESFVTAAGTYQLGSDAGVVLCNVAAAIVLNLPDVRAWVQEFAYQPGTSFERAIWIKDLGGFATANPIVINPFPGQFIDLLTSFQIINNYQLLRLYPLADLSGWFVG
jgi:hypothetical protein